MASSISLSEEDLSCPICFEEYNLIENDRMPKLLLCLHTVCFTCLENLLSDDDSVKCPICRTEHEIDEDLEDLLDNDAVITHIRLKQEEVDKKAALEVYWKEWLEKCSYEIPDDELRVNVQDLVRNSLTPFDGNAKHPSMPEQQDLQRRLQEKQEQQQQQQEQEEERYRRHIRHHNQEQRQAQQEEGFNWSELFEMLSQFLLQLNEQFNNPPHSNQHRQEAGEGSRQRRQETGEGRQHHRQEAEEERHQNPQFEGLRQLFEEVEVEEEEEEDDYEEDEDDEDENPYVYLDNEWQEIYDDDDDDQDEYYDYDDDDDDDDEEVEVVEIEAAAQAPQHQHQQNQHHHHHQQSQSNQSASRRTINVGRKIFVTGATVNKFADVGFIRNGFEDICGGSVDRIAVYCGTDICPCSYAILELRNNIYFVSGEYRFGGQTFKAKLCSGSPGKVFVARLPMRVENDEVLAHFRKFGNIYDFHRPVHRITGPVTYCFITFSEEETAVEVLKYENHYINGEKFVVRPHIDRP